MGLAPLIANLVAQLAKNGASHPLNFARLVQKSQFPKEGCFHEGHNGSVKLEAETTTWPFGVFRSIEPTDKKGGFTTLAGDQLVLLVLMLMGKLGCHYTMQAGKRISIIQQIL